MEYKIAALGQIVMKVQVPLDIFMSLNRLYEQNFHNLRKANDQLAGKIENEHSLYYNGKDTVVPNHNFLSKDIYDWFYSVFAFYLKANDVLKYGLHLNSVWVNEMKAHEYNPVHIHQGTMFTGLSSVMILKLPNETGVEYGNESYATNGALQILGNTSGQFAKIDYQPELSVRDFYIFPYDMRHVVYPFNGTKDTRRTLAANCDVDYDPIKNRGLR
mgnify:FL=1|tara:strand:+ start:1391 stop:2038 length:648 start_codon:yes stop_codon:yes gene_type:complete